MQATASGFPGALTNRPVWRGRARRGLHFQFHSGQFSLWLDLAAVKGVAQVDGILNDVGRKRRCGIGARYEIKAFAGPIKRSIAYFIRHRHGTSFNPPIPSSGKAQNNNKNGERRKQNQQNWHTGCRNLS